MGRQKRTSKVLGKAEARLAGLKILGPLDFGPGLTTATYEQSITQARTSLDDYNQALAAVDEKYNRLQQAEETLQDFSERMLAGVAARFGKDSTQYEQAGGVRKSERKRPAERSPKPPKPAP